MMEYSGDVNIKYGGQWINIDTFDDNYCDCLRVTDLDSGCGFTGGLMIEHLTILLDKNYWKESIACCDLSVADLLAMDSDQRKERLAECLLSYGHYDQDDSWDGYQHFWMETLQTEQDGPMTFDGWKADKRVLSENLDGYINAVHLN